MGPTRADKKQSAARIPTANNGVNKIVCDLAVSARSLNGDDKDRRPPKPIGRQGVLALESSQQV